jgi:hypothetical protein
MEDYDGLSIWMRIGTWLGRLMDEKNKVTDAVRVATSPEGLRAIAASLRWRPGLVLIGEVDVPMM